METRDLRWAPFERFAGSAARVVGLGGIVYAILFISLLHNATKGAAIASALLLMVGGVATTAVLIAVYGRLAPADPGFALWALLIGAAGAIGSALHGAFDLAPLAHRVGSNPLPANSTDPRGFATFALAAVALAIISWLIRRGGGFDRRLASVGLAAAALLIVIYLGRLIAYDPNRLWLKAAAYASGLVVNPVFFVWLGLELRRGSART